MIGYLSGKYIAAEGEHILIDVSGVGYQVLASSRLSTGLFRGQPIELYIHTNLRENALELFGFSNSWEKKVFLALVSVSGIGPRTAMAILGGLEPEIVLSAIVRGDRATLGGVSGIGKKTAERLIVELVEKARKLLTERPNRGEKPSVETESSPQLAEAVASKPKKKAPVQGASVSGRQSVDIADLWNEALDALVGLGYREGDAIVAIRAASSLAEEKAEATSLEQLVKDSLRLVSKGRST